MSQTPDNPVLEHLRKIQVERAAVRDEIWEVRTRQAETHSAVLAVQPMFGGFAINGPTITPVR